MPGRFRARAALPAGSRRQEKLKIVASALRSEVLADAVFRELERRVARADQDEVAIEARVGIEGQDGDGAAMRQGWRSLDCECGEFVAWSDLQVKEERNWSRAGDWINFRASFMNDPQT